MQTELGWHKPPIHHPVVMKQVIICAAQSLFPYDVEHSNEARHNQNQCHPRYKALVLKIEVLIVQFQGSKQFHTDHRESNDCEHYDHCEEKAHG